MFTRTVFAAALMSAVKAQLQGCTLQKAIWEKGCYEDIEESLMWIVPGTFTDSESCIAWATEEQSGWGCPEYLDTDALKMSMNDLFGDSGVPDYFDWE